MEPSNKNNNHHEGMNMDANSNNDGCESSAQPTQITSIDGFFNRKRGRPPKNRFVEVYKSVSKVYESSKGIWGIFSLVS